MSAMSGTHHDHDTCTFNLHCPKDGTLMDKVRVERITIDRCATCGAIWFDMNELQTLVKANKDALRAADVGPTERADKAMRTKNLACPRDGAKLVEQAFPDQSHIMVMKCGACRGMLLDAGEAKDVVSYTLLERVRTFFS
jgi:Zn-finger nucleic acid-binding protein